MTFTDPRLDHGVLPVLIWTARPDGHCDYVNERWSDYTGLPVADLLGWGWLDRAHPEDRQRVHAEYNAAVAARGPVRLEFRMLGRDNEYRWFLGTGEPCRNVEGEFIGYSGCSTDVTDRRALEQRLDKLGRTAEIAQLAGGIAHDFNNLLTGILGHVTLLLDGAALAPEVRQDLARIREGADRAATLSRQLLAFSRRPRLAPRALDLNQLVSGAFSTLRRVAGHAVEVSHELKDGLDPVLADPAQLEQILLRLGAHARAAMPAGGRLSLRTGRAEVDEVLAARSPGLRPASYITLEINHTGPELDSAALERMFDRSALAHGGVDLSAVADIARQSGGHVAVGSTPATGTTFTLYIPRLAPVATSTWETDSARHEGNETVLVVEDDAQVRDVMRRALERSGYTVLAVGDAEAAIALTDRHPGHIHLLITDLILPRMSGRELAARLAIHRPAIKVLYASGTSDGTVSRHRMLEPGTEFLEKPFSLDHLLRKVRQILGVGLPAEDATPWAQRSPA
jgi:PAS domain S-box-containing protein